MSPILIVLIVLAATGIVGGVGGWLWGKYMKNDITPFLEWMTMVAIFLVGQFDFLERELVLKVLGYVQTAYRTASQMSELDTLQKKIDYVIITADLICEAEGYDLDSFPMLKQLIEQAAILIVSYWAKQENSIEMIDVSSLQI